MMRSPPALGQLSNPKPVPSLTWHALPALDDTWKDGRKGMDAAADGDEKNGHEEGSDNRYSKQHKPKKTHTKQARTNTHGTSMRSMTGSA